MLGYNYALRKVTGLTVLVNLAILQFEISHYETCVLGHDHLISINPVQSQKARFIRFN